MDIKASTKLVDLGIAEETLINFTTGDTTKTLEVTSTTTIAELVSKAKEAGLNANFDETYKRLFVSSKGSGTENKFQITATTSPATAPKNDILDYVGYNALSFDDKKAVDSAIAVLGSDISVQADIDKATLTLEEYAKKNKLRLIESDIDAQIRLEVAPGVREIEENLIKDQVMTEQIQLLKEEARQNGATEEEIAAITKDSLNEEQLAKITDLQNKSITASADKINVAIDKKVAEAITAEKAITPTNRYTEAKEDRNAEVLAAAASVHTLAGTYRTNSQIDQTDVSSRLLEIGLDGLKADGTKMDAASTASTVVAAVDSKITYNNVELIGSSNVINVNGMTITLKGLSNGENVSLNVSNDTQATYDMVKKFISSYNDILKEMNTLYYANSAKGYDPLSDDEKEAMTEDQIEKWESKIKDSVLRRDSTLGSLLDVMKTSMMTSVEVDGSSYSLSSYGIQSSKDYSEKGLLHIYGNKEDPVYSANEDKLMKALKEDPDTVMKVLSGISKNLYDTMNDKMSSIPNVRSALTFYNDKTITEQQSRYARQISVLENKLIDTENKYYKQFAAMETAMAKMQSQSNALAGMLGTSSQK
jgi:flagellar hook-associated protein 2